MFTFSIEKCLFNIRIADSLQGTVNDLSVSIHDVNATFGYCTSRINISYDIKANVNLR